MKKDRLQQLQELLHEMGGTHSLEDIQALCENGVFQSLRRGRDLGGDDDRSVPAGGGDGHLFRRR